VYLNRDPVDFRKAINGLVLIIEQVMALSPFADALFLFCNKQRDKLKAVYWDQTGFVLWYKRLEQAQCKWPLRADESVVVLSEEQLHWLLRGFDIVQMQVDRQAMREPDRADSACRRTCPGPRLSMI
jgi:transposase